MTTKGKKKTKPIIEVGDDEFTYEDDISEMPEVNFDEVMSMIEDIDDLPIYVKALIFGDQGSGKTTFAGTGPAPVVFLDCNERGTASVRGMGHKRVRIRNTQDLENMYWYLYTQKHPYKTLVIDTTTLMADIVMAGVLKEDGHYGTPHKGHWGSSVAIQKNLLLRFRNLPMHVIFIAQLKRLDEDEIDSDDDAKTKVPMLSPAVRGMLGAAVDVIGYTYVKEVEKEVKGKLKTTFQYRMRIGPSSDILTKIRTTKGTKYPNVLVDPTFNKIFEIITKEE